MDWLKRFIETLSPQKEEYSVRNSDRSISLVRNTASGELAVMYNGIVYSRLRKGSVFTGSYWDFLLPVGCIRRSPRVLMIGLGGGTVAYQMERLFGRRVRLDVVELDRDMVRVAKRFYPGMRARIIVGDGSAFVKGAQGRYDAIILDAYANLDIPQEFLTEEFCAAAARALKRDGVLAINYAQPLMKAGQMGGYTERLARLFRVYLVWVGGLSNNAILLCSKSLGKREMLKAINERMPKGKEAQAVLDGYKRMVAQGQPKQKQ